MLKHQEVMPNATIADSESFKYKARKRGSTPAEGNAKDVEIVVPLKWRALEMSLINCKIKLMLTWSANCIFTDSTCAGTFATADTKPYVLVVTLATPDNTKQRQRVKLKFQHVVI